MKKTAKKAVEELAALAAMPDKEIDTSDIPEITDWSKAVVGRFYRPVKEAVTIRLDADVLDWLKQGGRGYQTRVNKILRAVMEQQRKKAAWGVFGIIKDEEGFYFISHNYFLEMMNELLRTHGGR